MTNEKIKLELESTATGTGFKKTQEEANKTKKTISDLGKGVKNLGSLFGQVGGKLGNAFQSILQGGVFGAISFGIQALVDKWKDAKQKAEEARKAQEEAVGNQVQTLAKESADSIRELVGSWEKVEKTLANVRRQQDELLKAQDEYTKAVRENQEAKLKASEAEELSRLNPTDKEGEQRIKTRYATLLSNLKSEQSVEDRKGERAKAQIELERTQADLARAEKRREELEEGITKRLVAGEKVKTELAKLGNDNLSKNSRTVLDGQVKRYAEDTKTLQKQLESQNAEIINLKRQQEIQQ